MNEEDMVDEEEVSDEIEVSVIDDRPEEDRVAPRDKSAPGDDDFDTDDEIAGAGEKVRKRIKRLRYEFHEERRAKEAAEKVQSEAVEYAKRVAAENERLKGVVDRGERVLLDQLKRKNETEIEVARNKIKAAVEEGDIDAQIAAQESLAQHKYEQVAANAFASRAMSDKAQINEQQQVQGGQNNGQQFTDPRAAEWAKRNTWFGKDNEMTYYAMGVHKELTDNGVSPLSDDYYKEIDKRVRNRFRDKLNVGGDEPAANERPGRVVAGASRSAGKRRTVQLTSTQVALANKLGITKEQYARELLKQAERNDNA